MGHATYSALKTGSFEEPETLFIDFFIIIKDNMNQINHQISEQRKYSHIKLKVHPESEKWQLFRVLTNTGTKDFLSIYTIYLPSFGYVLKIYTRLYIVTLLINLYAEYIMRDAGLEEAQAGIKIAGRNINNLRYADDTTLWQKVKKN